MRRRPAHLLTALPVLVVCPVLLAGCGSGGSDDRAADPAPSAGTSTSATDSSVPTVSAPAGDGGSGAGHTCDEVSASVVNAALGTSYGAPDQTVNGPITACMYSSKDGLQQGVVRFATGVDSLAVEKKGFVANDVPVSDLAGVGDEALQSTLGKGAYLSHTIVVREGDLEMLVTSQSSVKAEIALVNQVLG